MNDLIKDLEEEIKQIETEINLLNIERDRLIRRVEKMQFEKIISEKQITRGQIIDPYSLAEWFFTPENFILWIRTHKKGSPEKYLAWNGKLYDRFQAESTERCEEDQIIYNEKPICPDCLSFLRGWKCNGCNSFFDAINLEACPYCGRESPI